MAQRHHQQDIGFRLLPEQEQREQKFAEADRDIRSLQDTIRAIIPDRDKSSQLRILLDQVADGLSKERPERPERQRRI